MKFARRKFGVKITGPVVHLTLPVNFTPAEIAQHSIDLVKADNTPPGMLKRWMKLTGGIDGKPWGMEAGHLLTLRPGWAREVFLREVKPFLVVPAPVPKRFWQEEEQRRQEFHHQARQVFERYLRARNRTK